MRTETIIYADIIGLFTHAMNHDDVESMLCLWDPEGEWEVMATGEKFSGLDEIRQLVTRSVATRNHRSGERLLPFNVFKNEEETKFCWEYVHKGVVTDKWPAALGNHTVGTKFDLPIALMCDISNGKIVKVREYFDLLTLTKAGHPLHLYS